MPRKTRRQTTRQVRLWQGLFLLVVILFAAYVLVTGLQNLGYAAMGGGQQPLLQKKCTADYECQTWGTGAQCDTHADCRHKVCRSRYEGGPLYCVTLAGEGQSDCTTDANCDHRDCEGPICAWQGSGGQSTCNAQADCGHYNCTSPTSCDLVVGAGDDACQTDADCEESHKVCKWEETPPICDSIPGEGTDQCQVNTDCNI